MVLFFITPSGSDLLEQIMHFSIMTLCSSEVILLYQTCWSPHGSALPVKKLVTLQWLTPVTIGQLNYCSTMEIRKSVSGIQLILFGIFLPLPFTVTNVSEKL